MKRDNQRQRLYDAEADALSVLAQKRWVRVPEMQVYVDSLVATKWFRDRWPWLHKIKVKDGRGRRRACGGNGSVSMPLWTRREYLLLHEIAHCVTSFGALSWHGPAFCRA